MQYAVIAVIVVVIVGGFIYNYLRQKKIKENGIEVDAVISRIVEKESTDSDNNTDYTYEYYVKYTDQNGNQVEAKLSNPRTLSKVGDQLKIKYLPEKPKVAVRV